MFLSSSFRNSNSRNSFYLCFFFLLDPDQLAMAPISFLLPVMPSAGMHMQMQINHALFGQHNRLEDCKEQAHAAFRQQFRPRTQTVHLFGLTERPFQQHNHNYNLTLGHSEKDIHPREQRAYPLSQMIHHMTSGDIEGKDTADSTSFDIGFDRWSSSTAQHQDNEDITDGHDKRYLAEETTVFPYQPALNIHPLPASNDNSDVSGRTLSIIYGSIFGSCALLIFLLLLRRYLQRKAQRAEAQAIEDAIHTSPLWCRHAGVSRDNESQTPHRPRQPRSNWTCWTKKSKPAPAERSNNTNNLPRARIIKTTDIRINRTSTNKSSSSITYPPPAYSLIPPTASRANTRIIDTSTPAYTPVYEASAARGGAFQSYPPRPFFDQFGEELNACSMQRDKFEEKLNERARARKTRARELAEIWYGKRKILQSNA